MAATPRQPHLNLFIHGRGHHEAAWRHPSASKLALTDIRYYTGLARTAEAGLFDSVFLADTLAAGDDIARAPRSWLESVTTLAALAGATSRIGLIEDVVPASLRGLVPDIFPAISKAITGGDVLCRLHSERH